MAKLVRPPHLLYAVLPGSDNNMHAGAGENKFLGYFFWMKGFPLWSDFMIGCNFFPSGSINLEPKSVLPFFAMSLSSASTSACTSMMPQSSGTARGRDLKDQIDMVEDGST